MTSIHPTAIIAPSAEIDSDVEVGPYTIVEDRVRIGKGTTIGAHATLGQDLVLGEHCEIHNYACLGTSSQDRKHTGERSYAEIGNACTIREFATVNRGTREGSITRVGNQVLMLAYSHVAHECEVGDGATLVNGCQLGGEVQVGAQTVIGGLVGVHQFCRIGKLAMIGACSKVTRDVPPFLIADGHPARPFGPNIVGLRRNGFDEEQIGHIRQVMLELYRRERLFSESLDHIASLFPECSLTQEVLKFCRESERGVCHPRQSTKEPHSAEPQVFPQGAAPEWPESVQNH